MKQCPQCKTTYTDDSLQFCLSDGTALLPLPTNEARTVQMSYGANELSRGNVGPDSVPTVFAPPIDQNQPPKSRLGLVIAGLLGMLTLLIVGLVAAYFLLRSPVNQTVVAANSPIPTVAPSVSSTATPNDETGRLKEEMANLKKQLDAQKKQKQNLSDDLPTLPNNGRTARADSPSDGFLALRSEPSSDTGYRIAKIPHGATLTVFDCPKPSNIGKMSGRWCRVDYDGQTGWAFNGFMKF